MNQQEQQLRTLIREGIRIVKERRKKQTTSEEDRLRKVIRHYITEVSRKTAVADKVIHKNTGINEPKKNKLIPVPTADKIPIL